MTIHLELITLEIVHPTDWTQRYKYSVMSEETADLMCRLWAEAGYSVTRYIEADDYTLYPLSA